MSILVACIMYNKWQNNTKERHAKAEGAGERQNTAKPERERERKRKQARDKAQRQKKSIASSQKWTKPVKGICPYSRTHTLALPARHPVKCAKYFDIKPDVK